MEFRCSFFFYLNWEELTPHFGNHGTRSEYKKCLFYLFVRLHKCSYLLPLRISGRQNEIFESSPFKQVVRFKSMLMLHHVLRFARNASKCLLLKCLLRGTSVFRTLRVETPTFSYSSPSVIYVFCHWLEPVKDKDRCEVSFHRSQRAASRYVTRCSEPPELSKVFQFSSCDGAAVEINPLEKVTVCSLYWL